MILRLCLKDKSSILVEYNSLAKLQAELNTQPFIMVKNCKSDKYEIYNRDYIWCVRISSQNDGNINK